MPRDGEILLNLASVGKITIEGGLQLDMTRSQAGLRIFTWNANERTEGSDGNTATLTVAHPNDDYPDVEINVTRSEEAALSVEEDTPAAVLDKSDLLGLLNAYGGYIVSGLAVIGTLIFALAMPAHRNELISGAGASASGAFSRRTKATATPCVHCSSSSLVWSCASPWPCRAIPTN